MNEELDVNQAETTAEASSAETQTTETNQEASSETQDNSEVQSKTVPYERFSEVINSKKELESKITKLEEQMAAFKPSTPETPTDPKEEVVKQQLKKYLEDLGYVSKAELEAQEKQKESDRQLEQNISSLSQKYDGKDGKPKFNKSKVLEYASQNLIGNLEVAYKQMHEVELLDHAIKQALGKSKGVKTEVSDGSGASQVGTTQEDLMKAVQPGDSSALQTLIKRAI